MIYDIAGHPRKSNWALLVKYLLGSLGYNEVWLHKGVGDINLFLKIVKQRLCDNFIQIWNAEINQSTRAIFYRNIAVFKFQEYLDVVKVKKFRNALSRLRVSSHRLAVKTGRWNKPQRIEYVDRNCRICNKIRG